MTEILQSELSAEDENINFTAVSLFRQHGKKICTAESCTGGMIAAALTEVSGSSECFDGGYVTYSNIQKEHMLGVSGDTLKKYGAVSYQTALEMSRGAMERIGADIGIGVTGIAGPGGGSADKPVGLVYISACSKDAHVWCRLRLDGDRAQVRSLSCRYALDLAIRVLREEINK